MIKRTWYNWDINDIHKLLPIMQIYARIYVKSKKKIVIVSKDWLHWQMPWGKPEEWETVFGTLHREIYEETSINICKNYNPKLFGYYYIEENGTKYLQLRYFIEIDNINSEYLNPTEKSSPDSIKFIKLVTINEIPTVIPRLQNNWEFNSFNKIII